MRKRRELRLASRMESLRDIEEFSERISDEYFLNDSYFGNILTCLTEAVKNGIIHGNHLDERKSVFVLLEEKVEGLLFTVIDQGEGYNYKAINEKDLDENAGRGIVMIKSLADEVTVQNQGRVISMLFRINGIDQKVAESRITMLAEYEKVIRMLERKNLE
jgi:serine/threonine-protein kinase RsbW